MKFRKLIFACFAILLTYSYAFSQDSENVELIGYVFDRWDYASDIAVNGDIAYISTGHTGVKIVNISDPSNPILTVVFGDSLIGAQMMKIDSDLLYIVYSNEIRGNQHTIENHIGVFSIDDGLNPELLSFIQIEDGTFSQMFVKENFVFFSVTDNPWDRSFSQVFAIDYFDPGNPEISEIWSIDDYVKDLFIVDDIAYVLTREAMLILDISDYENIELISTSPDESFGGNDRIIVENDIAYVIDYNYVVCLDVSDLENPQLLGEVYTEGGCAVTIYDLSKIGNTLYFSEKLDWCDGSPTDGYVNAIDVSDPNNPVFLGRNDSWRSKFPTGIEITDEAVFVSLGKGLVVMDYSDPEMPVKIGEFDSGGDARRMSIFGDNLYVAEHESEYGSRDEKLQIIDITDPSNSTITSTNSILARGIDVGGEFACVLNDSGLQVFDISNPYDVSEISAFEIEHGSQVEIRDELVYINDNGYLVTFDVSDPDRPEIISELLLRQHRIGEYRFDLVGDYLYIGAKSGQVIVVDVSIPNNQRFTGQFDTGAEIVDIDVSGEFAFLSIKETGMLVLDVSDPSDMIDVNLYETLEPGIIDVSFDFVYLQTSSNRINVIDKSNPENLRDAGFYSFGERKIIRDIKADGTHIYVAFGENVAVLDNSMMNVGNAENGVVHPEGFEIVDVYPNPFNSSTTVRYNMPVSSSVSIAIYNSNGKQISELQSGVTQAGLNEYTWDASSVSAGVYFLKITNGNNPISGIRKIMLIK